MNINDFVVLFGLVVLVGVTVLRLWNLLAAAQWIQNWRIIALFFTGAMFSWFFILVGSMTALAMSAQNLIYISIMNLAHILLGLNTVFILIEIALYSGKATERQVDRLTNTRSVTH